MVLGYTFAELVDEMGNQSPLTLLSTNLTRKTFKITHALITHYTQNHDGFESKITQLYSYLCVCLCLCVNFSNKMRVMTLMTVDHNIPFNLLTCMYTIHTHCFNVNVTIF